MDTITWNGEEVTRVFTAYQSRDERPEMRSRLAGVIPAIPAEYAVKDQQGLIVARFDTMAEASAYADTHNA